MNDKYHKISTLDDGACFAAMAARDRRFDGRFFIAVRTTKIYCRPICPATPPKRENVTFYQLAAQAQQAGYRPCLRCRPEVAPHSPQWLGTEASVRRALRLIDEGALDHGSVESLAARLGMGARHLSRLFDQYLGVSPIQMAQNRRLHLAKALLHETNLPMTEIAFAAGYGSIRRFNEAFAQIFVAAPSILRKQATISQQKKQSHQLEIELPFIRPFDWTAFFRFFMARHISPYEVAGVYYYGRSFLVPATENVEAMKGHFVLRLLYGRLYLTICANHFGQLPALIALIKNMADVGTDPNLVAKALAPLEFLRPTLERHQGLRVPTGFCRFEGVLRAILGQQISLGAGVKLLSHLTRLDGEALGEKLPENLIYQGPAGTITHLFPDAPTLAGQDLSQMPMPKSRIATLIAFLEVMVARPDFLKANSADILRAFLAIKGVGPWTADYVALRALADPDAIPINDGALLAVAQRQGWISAEKNSAAELADLVAAARPYRAYVAQYIWQILVDELDEKPA